ncbi:MAG TPA: M48 family metalloprotease [Steroidobacteraceae bacterium]|nr:M48 family metalloprotease [Steroidobacteraceae bacterium]
MIRAAYRWSQAVAVATLVAACATNPITGEKDLMLVGAATELEIGRKNYAPMRQAEGGDYAMDPALTAYVQQVGQRVAAVSPNKLPYEFTVLNNSIPNAWALPGGKIAVNRGLLMQLKSEAELAAVLGHEVVHAAARHSAQQMSRGMLLQGGLIAAQVATSDSDYGGLAVAGAGIGAQLLMQRYGREAELESDKYGMNFMQQAGYDPQGAVTLQETFVRMNERKEAGWLAGLFASHPPSQERLDANRKRAAALPRGGELGVERYQAALAQTMRAKPAYDAYDEGRKALADKKADIAHGKAEQAIRLLPGEAHFHALKGDAFLVQKNYKAATQAYTDAIARNGGFFYYYLQRGLIAERERNDAAARSDLEASVKLLPTGPAYYSLGNIALRAGQRDAAKQYFAAASGAQGEVGEAATASLIRLELPENPGKYLRHQAALDQSGMLVVAIGNPTQVPVTGLAITVQYVDAAGRTRELRRELSGTLAAGQQQQVATGLGPFQNANQYRVTITSARVAE